MGQYRPDSGRDALTLLWVALRTHRAHRAVAGLTTPLLSLLRRQWPLPSLNCLTLRLPPPPHTSVLTLDSPLAHRLLNSRPARCSTGSPRSPGSSLSPGSTGSPGSPSSPISPGSSGPPSRGVTGGESAGVAREGESRHYRMRRVQVLREGKA